MTIRRSAVALAMLIFGLMPRVGQAQSQGQPGRAAPVVTMGPNYPNPYNPDTKVDFEIACENQQGRQFKVSVKIINILAQVVAYPDLLSSSSGVAGANRRMQNIQLPCGKYTANWNGFYMNSERKAASGMYMFSIEVDGRIFKTIRTTVAK